LSPQHFIVTSSSTAQNRRSHDDTPPSPPQHASQELPPGTELWILRLLVPLGGHKELVGGRGFSNDALAAALGLGAWVGESEKNIAAAFRQAEREGALLLIDEVDSFLRERSGAEPSWEVTRWPAQLFPLSGE
jgi:hypothetical protein